MTSDYYFLRDGHRALVPKAKAPKITEEQRKYYKMFYYLTLSIVAILGILHVLKIIRGSL